MSEEISRRMTEAAAAHGAEIQSGADVAHIAASIIGPARRRRRVTGAVTVTAAIAVLVAFAGGSLAVVDALGSKDANPGTVLPTSSLGNPVVPAPAVDPTASSATSPEPGKPLTEYPPAAPSRGAGFPDAYEMRDWVWDYVGAGWSLQSYSVSQDPYAQTPLTIPRAVVYLVSPEGAQFEVARLGPEQSAGMRVVSWQEDDRTAHLVWDGDAGASVPSGGGELDLVTGSVSPLTFSTPWGVSSTVAPLAVSATGNELWEAWVGDHQRFYRYGTADGWTVAVVNDIQGISDRYASPRLAVATSPRDGRLAVRPDSAAVLFEVRSKPNSVPSQAAVYDVDADVYVIADVSAQLPSPSDDTCWVGGWEGEATLSYACEDTTRTVIVYPDRHEYSGASYGERMGSGVGHGVLRTSVAGYRVATSVSYLAEPWSKTRAAANG